MRLVPYAYRTTPDSVERLCMSEAALEREQNANREATTEDLNNMVKESVGFRRC